jgi:cardiolipin synthase
MLRIEHVGAADRLAADFEASFDGRAQAWSEDFGELRLIGMNGRDNQIAFADVMAEIDRASSEICVVSPYLTYPFLDALQAAAKRGVKVRLITPLANNKPAARDNLLSVAARAGFEAHLTADMIHLKGMLIDERTLVLGSSNFDFVSYLAEEELLALVSDRDLIREFRAKVIAPLLAQALPASAYRPGGLAALRGAVLLKAGEWLVRSLPYDCRSARDWSD